MAQVSAGTLYFSAVATFSAVLSSQGSFSFSWKSNNST